MNRVMCATPAPTTHPALKAILWGGLLAGLGDYLFAHTYYAWKQGDFLAWKLGVFQTVAGGLIGLKTARGGGMPTYVLGVGLHFLIATIWAAIFWGLSRKLPGLVKYFIPAGLVDRLAFYYEMLSRKLQGLTKYVRNLPALIIFFIPAGLAYGLVVYYGMNCVVVPFSAIQSPVKLPRFEIGPIAAHLFLVGLPIAWATWKFDRRKIND